MLSTSSSESEEDEIPCRRVKVFRPRMNFHTEDPRIFNEKFRISKEAFDYVLAIIESDLQQSNRRGVLSPEQQLKVALHWMGNGGQMHGVADMHSISTPTVHRCIRKVCLTVVNKLFQNEVRWPNDCTKIAADFKTHCGFPQVGGCIDGSLIPIDGPTSNEPAFVDRHGKHSINCMVVCGPNLQFYHANANWPGSVHDSRVLRNSTLQENWENGWRPFPNAVLLGDSGYALKSWLFTPIDPTNCDPDKLRRYLRRHKSTRRLVECALGCLKEKFPSLNHLRLDPIVAGYVILTCITFYNIENRLKGYGTASLSGNVTGEHRINFMPMNY